MRDDARRAIAGVLGVIGAVPATLAGVVVKSDAWFIFCVVLACVLVALAVIAEVPDIKALMGGRQRGLSGGQSHAELPAAYSAPASPSDLIDAMTYIPFTPPVEHVLDAASARAELDGRRFLTADVLLAVLELPDSAAEKCLDRFSPGLADQVRLRLRNALESATKRPDYPKWQPFNLDLRREVLRARELAAEGGDPEVNELHLLLSILDNERSRTRQELANLLSTEGLNRLRNIAARILAEPVTPGSKTEKSS